MGLYTETLYKAKCQDCDWELESRDVCTSTDWVKKHITDYDDDGNYPNMNHIVITQQLWETRNY